MNKKIDDWDILWKLMGVMVLLECFAFGIVVIGYGIAGVILACSGIVGVLMGEIIVGLREQKAGEKDNDD